MNIGIIGAGSIARIMARTVAAISDKAKIYAIASRSLEKAQEFAKEFNIEKAYGSYEEMLKDPAVDLVYIATPHSQHYQNMKLCIANRKAVLCEKAFTQNTKEAEEILKAAEQNNVLVTEAIWTRYMPSRKIIMDTINSGIIGRVDHLSANLHYSIENKERMTRPELAGGALLDLGVYCLNFATMFFGDDIEKMDSSVALTDTGVDKFNSMTVFFKSGKIASLTSGFTNRSDRKGIFHGSNGYAVVENINNPSSITCYDTNDVELKHIDFPEIATGYEYEVLECRDILAQGKIECPSMPHEETIFIMKLMDSLRKEWGVVYPGEKL
ncbi:Gfo/Idh/MocA family protein [Treponema sp.]|uniref:Gfo/Idh/MocA family protein n=1 Tax=Treponema sp. TaxID=166 RepID=UPI00388D4B88